LIAVALVLISIALVTIYFRESEGGTLHGAQRIGVSVAMPFEVAGERVARPFKDAYGWASDLFSAKSENEELKKELEEARTRLIQNETAVQENAQLRELLAYVDGPRFPENYGSVVTRVVGRPPTAYDQEIVIAAGTANGIQRNDPVLTKVTLLTDQSSAVSAMVLESGSAGIVRHGPSDPSALILDRVGKDALVEDGDLVITAGWQSGKLESLYPRGIPIGTVESVGQQDVDLYKRIQIAPLVNFDSLSDVVVLVPMARPK
jgi:rod shape-determining protein MreC